MYASRSTQKSMKSHSNAGLVLSTEVSRQADPPCRWPPLIADIAWAENCSPDTEVARWILVEFSRRFLTLYSFSIAGDELTQI